MNYAQHNKEVKTTLLQQSASDSNDRAPIIFTKADSSLLKDHKPFFLPDFIGQIDYETELVVRICRLGKSVPERFAHRYYDAVTVGIDFTAREMQKRLREEGGPWDICKGFDGSAVIGDWVTLDRLIPARDNGEISISDKSLEFSLDINGTTVQHGYSSEMIHNVDHLVSYISQFFTLKTGDLLYTGTPVGVGPVKIDDHLEGYLEGRKVLDFHVK